MPLTLRAWSRYVVPLTVLSVVALAPLVWLAFRVGSAPDLVKARAQVRLGWVLAAAAWACQMWLVAGVSPAVRGLVRGEPLSQVGALVHGLRGLARGLVPCSIAVLAVVLGGFALVVPGVVLLVLVARTGASEELAAPPAVAVADAVGVARTRFAHVALLVAAIIAVDLAIAFVLQWQLVARIAKKPPAVQLESVRTFVRCVPLAIAVVSPVAACALAAAYARLSRTAR